MPEPLARAKAQTETQLVRAILQYLAANRVLAWRSNTGAAMNPAGRLVRFGKKGMPDIAGVLPGGRALFLEVKRPGRVTTREQVRMLNRLTEAGALAVIVYGVEDVHDYLLQVGVKAL